MMQIKVDRKEMARLEKFTKMLSTKGATSLKGKMYTAANDFRNTVIRNMKQTPKDMTKSYGKRGHHPSKPGHPPAIDTSNAITSMYVRSTITGAEYFIYGAPYMEYHELGVTGSWTIKTKTAKVLSDGESFFGKEVTHPGLPKRPFAKPIIDRNQQKYRNLFDKAVFLLIESDR